MSPVDPQTLAKAASVNAQAHFAELIDQDRSCKCGYNLKGLRVGGRCPECGRAISSSTRFKRGMLDDSLTDAPMAYLRLLAIGCILMMFGSLGTVFLLRFGWSTQNQWLAIGAGIAAIAWLAGVYILTDPRRSDAIDPVSEKRQWRKTRWVVRILFLAWLGASIAVYLGIRLTFAGVAGMRMGQGAGPAAYVKYTDIAAGICVFIGIAAFIPFSIMLIPFAEWARAYSMAERLRSAAWGLCVGGFVAILCHVLMGKLGPLDFIAVVLRSLGAVAFLLGLGLFIISTMQLAVISVWAIRNAHEHGEVNQRRAERQARELERDMAIAPPPGVQPSAVFSSQQPAVPASAQQHYPPSEVRQGFQRERPADLDTYDLAPDDEPQRS